MHSIYICCSYYCNGVTTFSAYVVLSIHCITTLCCKLKGTFNSGFVKCNDFNNAIFMYHFKSSNKKLIKLCSFKSSDDIKGKENVSYHSFGY